jgi:hypothetical protein
VLAEAAFAAVAVLAVAGAGVALVLATAGCTTAGIATTGVGAADWAAPFAMATPPAIPRNDAMLNPASMIRVAAAG